MRGRKMNKFISTLISKEIKYLLIMIMVTPFVLTPVLAFAGSKQIRIESSPPGATIYIDNIKVGKTPLSVDVQGRWWYESDSTHVIKAEKEGYETMMKTVSATKFNVAGICGGVLCLFPFLWAAETPDVVVINLPKKE
jgi:hypothetical protein